MSKESFAALSAGVSKLRALIVWIRLIPDGGVFRSRVPRLSSSSPLDQALDNQARASSAKQQPNSNPLQRTQHIIQHHSSELAPLKLHQRPPFPPHHSSAPSMSFTTAHEGPVSELSLLEQLPLADLTHPPPHPGPTIHHRTLSVLSNTNCVNQSHPGNSSKLSFVRA
jgi:hypothetical protein